MWKKLKRKLEKIQDSDETTKKRWLIGTTTVAMILVIVLWLVYINWVIKSANETEVKESSLSFWQIFKNGLNIISKSIWNNIKDFVSKITSERTIIIEK